MLFFSNCTGDKKDFKKNRGFAKQLDEKNTVLSQEVKKRNFLSSGNALEIMVKKNEKFKKKEVSEERESKEENQRSLFFVFSVQK